MSVRFISKTHQIRELKDAISRDILEGFDKIGIGIASGTCEVVGMPPLKVTVQEPDGGSQIRDLLVPNQKIKSENHQ